METTPLLWRFNAMNQLIQALLEKLIAIDPSQVIKIVISSPRQKEGFQKIAVTPIRMKGTTYYQFFQYTAQQVFHDNVLPEHLLEKAALLFTEGFKQMLILTTEYDYSFRISKSGGLLSNRKRQNREKVEPQPHNREKHYLLPEGDVVPALVDLGIITSDGKVVRSMYDKYKQINRFLEMVEDVTPDKVTEPLHIVDFGCGKSYLTFVLYYYFTVVKRLPVLITGLDLKKEVVEHCNQIAEKYGYRDLHFFVGDIAQYNKEQPIDMVITLHACDTATDYALYAAVCRQAKVILSVPCCQHELNKQIKTESLSALTRFGIIKERFSALSTDAIRGCLLEACGYQTQILEFIDIAHSPKNLMIRAVRSAQQKDKALPSSVKESVLTKRKTALQEAERLMQEFQFVPTLYRLLKEQRII